MISKSDTPQPLIRKLQSRKKLRRLMRNYYLLARYAPSLGKKIAYVTSGAPVEILYALGYIPIYPENHSAIVAASKLGGHYCEEAEAYGYSRDLCSYARCDLTVAFTGKTPVGKLPPPDLLVACNNICGTVIKWYEILQKHFQVPLVIIDTPFLHDKIKPHMTEYVLKQLEHLVEVASSISRRSFSEKKLKKVISLSLKGINLWKEILRQSQNRPAPITCFDAFIHLAPIVTLRGTHPLLRYYSALLKEVKERVTNGIGAIPQERFRVLWDNIPIWYEIRSLGEFLAERGVVLVADTYTNAWTMDKMKPEKGLDGLAEAYLSIYLNLSIQHRLEKIRELIHYYSADGIIMHSNRSCKAYSFGQLSILKKLQDEDGIPGVLIEADMADPRAYSREQTKNRLQSFIEMLE